MIQENRRDWDEYGALYRMKTRDFGGMQIPINYVDLREFDRCHVIPIGLPTNLHFYRNDTGGICSAAFVVRSRMFSSVYHIHEHLVRPGIHYVLYAVYHDAYVQLRSYSIETGTPEHDGSIVKMMSVTDRLKLSLTAGSLDLKLFPHSCPRCHAPAYVGFSDVDCSRGCR